MWNLMALGLMILVSEIECEWPQILNKAQEIPKPSSVLLPISLPRTGSNGVFFHAITLMEAKFSFGKTAWTSSMDINDEPITTIFFPSLCSYQKAISKWFIFGSRYAKKVTLPASTFLGILEPSKRCIHSRVRRPQWAVGEGVTSRGQE